MSRMLGPSTWSVTFEYRPVGASNSSIGCGSEGDLHAIVPACAVVRSSAPASPIACRRPIENVADVTVTFELIVPGRSGDAENTISRPPRAGAPSSDGNTGASLVGEGMSSPEDTGHPARSRQAANARMAQEVVH